MADQPAPSGNWKKWAAAAAAAGLAAFTVAALADGGRSVQVATDITAPAYDGSRNPFKDVDETHPRYWDIRHAVAQGWFQGYPDGTFRPDRSITPAEFARIIERAQPDLTRSDAAAILGDGVYALRLKGIDVTYAVFSPMSEPVSAAERAERAERVFSDVDETTFLSASIRDAVERGWFQGYPDGTFRPDRSITPAQLARIVERAQLNLTRGAAALFLRAGIRALKIYEELVTDTTLPPPPEPTTTAAPTTTTTTVPYVAVTSAPAPPRVSHPTWDSRLPSTWAGLKATECNNTFRPFVIVDPPAWDYWWGLTRAHLELPEESWVIAEALNDPSYEPDSGTWEHTAITNLGLTSAQDIRGIGEGAVDVRWYALWLKKEINVRGDPNHPACAPILAGANAVLNAPYTTTTTRAGS